MKFLLPLLVFLLFGCFKNKTEYRVFEKKLARAQGEKFIFEYSGEVSFSKEVNKNIQICVIDKKRKKHYVSSINDNLTYKIETALSPGDYQIYSEITGELPNSRYWNAYGGNLSIDEHGNMKLKTQPLIHYLKMKLVSPISKVVVNEVRPTLKWQAVEGAVYYTIYWYEKEKEFESVDIRQGMKTNETEYRIEEDLEPDEMYLWGIVAYDQKGFQIAYFSVESFRTDRNLN